MKFHSVFLVLFLFICCGLASAQQAIPAQAPAPQRPSWLVTPEVHADNSVTFRFLAPNAQEVKLAREGTDPVAMQKDDKGVWSVTTAPLAPDYYGYSIIVDGVRMLDPYNHGLVPNLLYAGKFRARPRAVAALGSERCAARRSASSLLQVGRGRR